MCLTKKRIVTADPDRPNRTSEEGASLLVVEDDQEMVELIDGYFTQAGYSVSAVSKGPEVRNLVAKKQFDIAIVDFGLPAEEGMSVVHFLREHTGMGIIVLSRDAGLAERVRGLEIGADDYVAKPVHLRELLARVRSVLRRIAQRPNEVGVAQHEVREFGGWTFDLFARRLLDANGIEHSLTSAEFNLLAAFVRNPNRILSRNRLLEMTRGPGVHSLDRGIDVLVGRLRRKLEADPDRPRLIQTAHGSGYLFVAETDVPG